MENINNSEKRYEFKNENSRVFGKKLIIYFNGKEDGQIYIDDVLRVSHPYDEFADDVENLTECTHSMRFYDYETSVMRYLDAEYLCRDNKGDSYYQVKDIKNVNEVKNTK